jgi:hypothetical protein
MYLKSVFILRRNCEGIMLYIFEKCSIIQERGLSKMRADLG